LRSRQAIALLIVIVIVFLPYVIFSIMGASSNLMVAGYGWLGIAGIVVVVAIMAGLFGSRIRKWVTES
jgi:Na+/proline symporter